MLLKNAEANATLQITKSPSEVFEGIVDPGQMTNYFISKSSGRMEAGARLMWEFPEFDGAYPVRVGELVQDELIRFYWDVDEVECEVGITLSTGAAPNSAVVRISEKGKFPDTESALKFMKSNTEGWANFLACLKAWLEYGINLRKGAFEFMNEDR